MHVYVNFVLIFFIPKKAKRLLYLALHIVAKGDTSVKKFYLLWGNKVSSRYLFVSFVFPLELLF